MFNIQGYATVFQVEDKGKFVKANLSTSRMRKKGKDSNGEDIKEYYNSSWKGTFVGSCLEEAKKLVDKDRIQINNGYISHEASLDATGQPKVDGNNNKIYYTSVTIFDFEIKERKNSDNNYNKHGMPPAPVDEDSDELPF